MHAGLHQDAPELVRNGVVAVRERRARQRREPHRGEAVPRFDHPKTPSTLYVFDHPQTHTGTDTYRVLRGEAMVRRSHGFKRSRCASTLHMFDHPQTLSNVMIMRDRVVRCAVAAYVSNIEAG